jgi:hypothetical protein
MLGNRTSTKKGKRSADASIPYRTLHPAAVPNRMTAVTIMPDSV